MKYRHCYQLELTSEDDEDLSPVLLWLMLGLPVEEASSMVINVAIEELEG